jgi:DNA-binding beta-propeller fold protein YncE
LAKDDYGPHGATSLAIDGEDNVYISDGRSHQIRKFTKDGRLLNSWGGYGNGIGEFDGPWGITCDCQGYVYVADFKNHRIQKFSSAGEWVTQFGNSGSEAATLFRPTDVAVDPEGDVYVTDWGSNGVNPGRVQIYDFEGNFIAHLMGDCVDLSKWAQAQVDANPDTEKARRIVPSLEPQWRFALPTGIVFDPSNSRFLVSERPRHRVQIYNKLKDYQEAPINL